MDDIDLSSAIRYRAKLYTGEEIEILLFPGGKSACPVCGSIWSGEPAYHCGEFDQAGIEVRPPQDWANGSHNGCPTCSTEYGDSDFISDFPDLTQQQIWEKLRQEWLARTGWNPKDVERINRVLGIEVRDIPNEKALVMRKRVAMTPREIARMLSGAHAKLNAVREVPIRVVELPGARVGVLPGTDSPFASATKNRATVYDPCAGNLVETLRAAQDVYAEAGIAHWFAEIGPGATSAQITAAMEAVGARAVPYVRYPLLAREPGPVAPKGSAIEVRRASVEDVRTHAAEIDAIWGRPGSGAATQNAVGRDGYAVVLGFAEGRVAGMGMLIAPGKVGGSGRTRGIGYLSSGGTAELYRGRGGQSAIIAERVRIAHEWGCDVCVSETVSAVMTSENNLRRAGFGVVFEWVMVEVGEYVGEAKK
jgi:GNAT superfamily N-acetyltransferase